MVTKTQLAFLLVSCVIMSLLIEPAVSQKDALRWGKRDYDSTDDMPINPKHRRRQYDNEEDYYSK